MFEFFSSFVFDWGHGVEKPKFTDDDVERGARVESRKKHHSHSSLFQEMPPIKSFLPWGSAGRSTDLPGSSWGCCSDEQDSDFAVVVVAVAEVANGIELASFSSPSPFCVISFLSTSSERPISTSP